MNRYYLMKSPKHDYLERKRVNSSWPFCGDRDRIQTYNLLIRSQMLYSIELRSQTECKYKAKSETGESQGLHLTTDPSSLAHIYQAKPEILYSF